MIERLQEAARDGGHPELLVSVDQEGGKVRRFRSLPPGTAPVDMDGAGEARRHGAASARALASLGVNVNLAPVVDVVGREDSFLGKRAFGTDGADVADRACGFAAGSAERGVVPTLSTSRGSAAPQGTRIGGRS